MARVSKQICTTVAPQIRYGGISETMRSPLRRSVAGPVESDTLSRIWFGIELDSKHPVVNRSPLRFWAHSPYLILGCGEPHGSIASSYEMEVTPQYRLDQTTKITHLGIYHSVVLKYEGELYCPKAVVQ